MAAYDYVGMQGPPTAQQWSPTPIDFSGLAKIPGAIEQARQVARTRAIQGALPEGLNEFYDPNTGTYDYHGLVDRMIRVAGPEGAAMADQLMNTAFQTQLQPAKTQVLHQDFPATNPQTGTQQNENGGQSSQPQGYGTSGYPPPFAGSRTPKESPGATGPGGITGSTDGARDSSGSETLRSLYTGLSGGRDVSSLIARVGPRYGSPDRPLTAPEVAEATTIYQRFKPSVNATGGVPLPTGNAGGAGQTSTVSATQSNNQNSVGEPLSQGMQPNSAAEVNRNGPPQQTAQGGGVQVAQGGVAVPQAGVQAAPAPAYQLALQKADLLREAAKRADLLGMKDRAATLNKQADDQMKIAEQEPQHQMQIATGKTLAEKTVPGAVTRLENFQASADSYNQQEKPLLTLAQSVLSNPDVYTGAGGKLALDFNKVRSIYGDQNGGLLEQMLTKITAQSVLGDISQQRFDAGDAGASGGRIFKQTVDLVTQAAPSLEGTVAGNRALVAIKMKLGQVKSDIAQMANNYVRDPQHPYLDAGFDKMLQDYGTKLALWTKEELANPKLIAAPHAPGTLGSMQEYSAWGKKMGLSKGDPFYGPKGNPLEMR